MTGALLRDMCPADAPGVASIEKRIFYPPWSAADFLTQMSMGCRARVAELDGKVAGYCLVKQVLDEAEIYTIGVDEAFQGRGLGRLLLDDALEAARKNAVLRMFLEVRVTNEAAKGLYASAGFVRTGLRRGYYRLPDGTREDALVLSKDISHGS